MTAEEGARRTIKQEESSMHVERNDGRASDDVGRWRCLFEPPKRYVIFNIEYVIFMGFWEKANTWRITGREAPPAHGSLATTLPPITTGRSVRHPTPIDKVKGSRNR